MFSRQVYDSRKAWLKCELLGKTQELACIKKDREDIQHKLEGLDYKESLAQYVIKKVNEELEELEDIVIEN